MSKYSFVGRDSQNGQPRIVAIVTIKGGVYKWSGPEAKEIKTWLKQEKFPRLKGKGFDENNPKHWKLLPNLVSGSYFWVHHKPDSMLKEFIDVIK